MSNATHLIYPKSTTVTIASGQTTSAEVDLGRYTLVGIQFPSTFDGTTLTLQMAPSSGGTFTTVQTAGSDYTITSAASKYHSIDNLAVTAGLRYIKLVAGSAQAATDSVLTLQLRAIY